MAKIKVLKDKEGGKIYPITSETAVLDTDGVSIASKVALKVDKVDGKGLSTNDYTDAQKAKLAGVAEGADVTTVVQTLTEGTEIGSVQGVKLYAPEGGASDADDVTYDSTKESHTEGSVGAELGELSQLVSEKQDAPESAGTEGQVLGLDSELKPVWKDAGGDTDEIEEVSAAALVETREYIDSLLNGITSKGKVIMSKDVVDTLTSLSSLRPLSAFQGRLLNENTLDNEQVTAAAICALSGMLKPAAIAPEYSASKVYTVGQYVINDGYLYKCSTAIEKPEFFDSDKWTLTSVMEVISSL